MKRAVTIGSVFVAAIVSIAVIAIALEWTWVSVVAAVFYNACGMAFLVLVLRWLARSA